LPERVIGWRAALSTKPATKIGLFFAVMMILGFGVIVRSKVSNVPIGLMWALACLAFGGLIGFLFGIPRVVQQGAAPVPVPVPAPAPDAAPVATPVAATQAGATAAHVQAMRAEAAGLSVNTNLEQISDWLTKIIVGVGLVELRNLPGFINKVGTYVSSSSTDHAGAKALAVATLIYFAVTGFLGAYLLTRTYLTSVFRSADTDATGVRVGEGTVPVSRAFGLLGREVSDLRAQIVKVHPRLFENAPPAPAGADQAPPVTRKVLWVDDRPGENALLVEDLKRNGFLVDTSPSTAEAVAKLSATA
jgi:hypothetical protein